MRFCQAHWDALRAAITARGLERFVAKSGMEVVTKLMQDDGQSATDFEPLMGAHMIILSRMMEIGGLEIMMPNSDGSDRCPLCYGNEQHKINCKDGPGCTWTYDSFIDFAADDALAEATRRGLISHD